MNWISLALIFGAIYYFFGFEVTKWSLIVSGIVGLIAIIYLCWEKGMFSEYF